MIELLFPIWIAFALITCLMAREKYGIHPVVFYLAMLLFWPIYWLMDM